jgi:hypothetical protein
MQKLTQVVRNRASNIEEAKLALQRLDQALTNTGLDDLKNFNKAYWIITKNVLDKRNAGHFGKPGFLEKFDGCFAEYYLGALNNYLRNRRTAPAWKLALDTARHEDVSPVIVMGLGINAHINNDIAQALHDCRAEDKHYGDFLYINDVILESIYEVIDSLMPSSRLTDPKLPMLKPGYKLAMNQLARRWRQNAWDNFQKLRSGATSIKEIEDSAYTVGKRLARLPV